MYVTILYDFVYKFDLSEKTVGNTHRFFHANKDPLWLRSDNAALLK